MCKRPAWTLLTILLAAGCSSPPPDPVTVRIECRLADADPVAVRESAEALEEAMATLDGLAGTQAVLLPDRVHLWVDLRKPRDEAVKLINNRTAIADLPEHERLSLSTDSSEAILIKLSYKTAAADEEEAITRSRRLRTIAEFKLRERLLRIPHVEDVTVAGGVRERIEIRIDPARLKQAGLTADQVVNDLDSKASDHDLTADRLAGSFIGPRDAELGFPANQLADVAMMVDLHEGPKEEDIARDPKLLDVCVAVHVGPGESVAELNAAVHEVLKEAHDSTMLPEDVQIDRQPSADETSVQMLVQQSNRQRTPQRWCHVVTRENMSLLQADAGNRSMVEVRGPEFDAVHRVAGQLAQAVKDSAAIKTAKTEPARLPGDTDAGSRALLDRGRLVVMLGDKPYQTQASTHVPALYRSNRECVSFVICTPEPGSEPKLRAAMQQAVAKVKKSLGDQAVRLVIP